MPKEALSFPPEIYSNFLTTINGIKVSKREIDIVACILNGRTAKGIASLLTIAPRTVESHLYNVMKKLGCISREGLISLIESSNELLILKRYYLALLTNLAFEQTLKSISKLKENQESSCLIVYWGQEEKLPLFSYLKSHFELASVKVSLEKRENWVSLDHLLSEPNSPNWTFYVLPHGVELTSSSSLFTSKASSLIEKILFLSFDKQTLKCSTLEGIKAINFLEDQSYYFLFFGILKKLFSETYFNPFVEEFRKKYQILHQSSEERNPLSLFRKVLSTSFFNRKLRKENTNQKHNKYINYILNYCKKNTINTLIVFISFLFITCFFILNFETEEIINATNKYKEKINFPQSGEKTPSQVLAINLPNHIAGFVDSVPCGFSKSYLTQIWEALHVKTQSTLANKVSLSGMGGVGKTTLAIAYAYEVAQQKAYDLIIWINSETRENLVNSYEKALKKLKVFLKGNETSEEIIDLFKETISLQKKWLVIYDNAPTQPFLEDKIPLASQGHILVTSRCADEWENPEWRGKLISLEVFREEESIRYILAGLGLKEKQELKSQAAELAYELGNLPLALSHAVAYINYMEKQGETIFSYLRKIKIESHDIYEDLQHSTFKRPLINQEYFIAKALSFTGKNLTSLEHKLMSYFSYLNPDKIDLTFFNQIASEKELRKASANLANLSLIKSSYPFVSIHRLVQLAFRTSQNNRNINEVLEELMMLFKTKSNDLININYYLLESHEKVFNFLFHIYPLLEHTRDMKINNNIFYDLQFISKILYLTSKDISSYSMLNPNIKINFSGKKNYPVLNKRQEDILTQFKILFEDLPEKHFLGKIEHFFKATDPSHPRVQCTVGSMYMQGIGVPQNYEKAFQWFEKAATQNDPKAQYYMGQLYRCGAGIVRDEKKAYEWYQKAADQGDWYAQDRLGKAYRKGKVVPQDKNKSQYYYKKAFASLKKVAKQEIDLRAQGRAQYRLGKMYEHGWGAEIDQNKAMYLYLKANKLDYYPARRKILELAKSWQIPHKELYMSKAFIYSSKDIKEWKKEEIRQEWLTDCPVTLIPFKDAILSVYIGQDNKIYLSSSIDGQEWKEPWSPNLTWSTSHAVSLISFKEKLFLAYIGQDNKIYLSSSIDGQEWKEPWSPNLMWSTNHAVSLVSFKEKLFLAYVGEGHNIYVSSSIDGKEWKELWESTPASENFTNQAVSLASFKGQIFLAYTAKDPYKRRIFLTSSPDGKEWKKSWEPKPAWWFTSQTVNLISFKDKLLLVHVGGKPNKGKIFLSSTSEGKTWEEAWELSDETFSNYSVNLANFQGKLFLAYVGIEENQFKQLLSYINKTIHSTDLSGR